MDLPEDWPVARYRLTFEVTKPMTLPDYGGSAIRGAFGHALRRTACMTHQTSCPSCPLYRTCPYAAIFEPPPPAEHELQRFSSVPVPYVIEAPLGGRRTIEAGERLSFTVVLFGRAIEQLALIIYAFERAFRHEVFQGGRRTAELGLASSGRRRGGSLVQGRTENQAAPTGAEAPCGCWCACGSAPVSHPASTAAQRARLRAREHRTAALSFRPHSEVEPVAGIPCGEACL